MLKDALCGEEIHIDAQIMAIIGMDTIDYLFFLNFFPLSNM